VLPGEGDDVGSTPSPSTLMSVATGARSSPHLTRAKTSARVGRLPGERTVEPRAGVEVAELAVLAAADVHLEAEAQLLARGEGRQVFSGAWRSRPRWAMSCGVGVQVWLPATGRG
jgi:hypothetical protein